MINFDCITKMNQIADLNGLVMHTRTRGTSDIEYTFDHPTYNDVVRVTLSPVNKSFAVESLTSQHYKLARSLSLMLTSHLNNPSDNIVIPNI